MMFSDVLTWGAAVFISFVLFAALACILFLALEVVDGR